MMPLADLPGVHSAIDKFPNEDVKEAYHKMYADENSRLYLLKIETMGNQSSCHIYRAVCEEVIVLTTLPHMDHSSTSGSVGGSPEVFSDTEEGFNVKIIVTAENDEFISFLQHDRILQMFYRKRGVTLSLSTRILVIAYTAQSMNVMWKYPLGKRWWI